MQTLVKCHIMQHSSGSLLFAKVQVKGSPIFKGKHIAVSIQVDYNSAENKLQSNLYKANYGLYTMQTYNNSASALYLMLLFY